MYVAKNMKIHIKIYLDVREIDIPYEGVVEYNPCGSLVSLGESKIVQPLVYCTEIKGF